MSGLPPDMATFHGETPDAIVDGIAKGAIGSCAMLMSSIGTKVYFRIITRDEFIQDAWERHVGKT